jgi:anti-repressor protein
METPDKITISEAFVGAAIFGFPYQQMLRPILGDVIMNKTAIAVSIQQAFNTEQEGQFKSVNLRDVHSSLEIKKDFSNWVKAKLKTYNLEEGNHYVRVDSPTSVGGTFRSDYYVRLDVAKRIAVDSNTAKGEELRQYLTAFEEAVSPAIPEEFKVALRESIGNSQALMDALSSLIEFTTALKKEHEATKSVNLCLKKVMEETEADVRAFNLLCHTEDGNLCFSDAAKHLKMGPRVLTSWMLKNGWLMRRARGTTGKYDLVAYQNKINAGLLEHVSGFVTRKDGSTVMSHKVVVTEKGLVTLAKMI